MTGLSASGLRTLLSQNVVELSFIRRHKKYRWPMDRRMLCTLDKRLLNSLPGKVTLNFRVPTQPPAYNPMAYNLVCAWDILWQDWRMIPVDATVVINAVPTSTKEDQEKFWAYFTARFQYMSSSDKTKFMKNALM